ncbi:MFS transporter [Sphingosinicella terrae]|uniref:MFS transporter n=1 Tax=Sphingosinicella terrae TaxID=2172047 RepID=UPI000E0D63C3|nr:MFS transporter [Sphingosinicella terrae]
MKAESRIVLALAASQALHQTSAVLIVTIGGLAGMLLAPEPAMATLPLATIALGTALTIVPASLLMARIGRKAGFLIGALAGAGAGAVGAWGLLSGSFVLLCAGTGLAGVYQGFAQYYRFAAAEAAEEANRGRAISWVLAGGVIAALAGPALGTSTRGLLAADYAGSFLAVLLLGLAAAVLLAFTRLPQAEASSPGEAPARSLREIARQPLFRVAVIGAAAAFGVMVTVMTATPISMVAHAHDVGSAAMVIQWHVLGMFLPSFFSGPLIRRVGALPLMLGGTALLAGHVAIALSGTALLNFLSGLVLVGVGWNFLYVGGSTLLLDTYRPSERAKVQALNDFLIVGVAAAGSFSAGALADAFGWRGVNLAALPVLLLAALAIAAALRLERRRVSAMS